MSILPPLALRVIFQYWSLILSLVSRYTYELLLQRYQRHWLVQLKSLLDLTPLEQACADYHRQNGRGQPVRHTVPRLLRAVLVKYLANLSLRQTEEQVDCHLLSKWFVGYGLLEPVFDHTTLERFELWLLTYHPRLFFDEVLQQIDRAFPADRRSPQVVDSYALLARAAKTAVGPLLQATCRHLLSALQQAQPAHHAQVVAHLNLPALLGSAPDPDWTFLDVSERASRLQQVVSEALRCRRLVAGSLLLPPLLPLDQQQPIQEWLTRLDKLLNDEVSLTVPDPSQPDRLLVTELPNAHKGSYRLASATDPDATYREHGQASPAHLGYNVALLTSCHFIRDIQAHTGCTPDPWLLPDLLTAQATFHGFWPEWVIGDMAFGYGKTRRQVQLISQGQTRVVAKLPPYDTRSDRFTPYDFTLSPDGASLTCPHQRTTTLRYRSHTGEGDDFRFPAKLCQGCPFWPQPPVQLSLITAPADPRPLDPLPPLLPPGTPLFLSPQTQSPPPDRFCRDPHSKPTAHRMLFISDYRSEVQTARSFNRSAQFKQLIKLRPLIERIIFNLTHYHGSRHAARTGQLKADFQVKMNATAFNLRQWLRLRPPTPPLSQAQG